MKKELSSMLIHVVAGILMGYISFWFADALYSLVLAIVVAYALKGLTVKLFDKKELGWWFGNGGVVYIFMWLITWIMFFNL